MKDIYLYGELGPSYWGLIDASSIVDALPKSGDVTLHINSPGGDVFEGVAIYNRLRKYKGGSVRVEIDALAASAASLVAMAGQEIEIAENAMMMLHDPWVVTAGNAAELRKMTDTLDQVAASLAKTYAGRTGLELEEVQSMMAEETWMDAATAVELGFATSLAPRLNIAACLRDGMFEYVPDQIAARATRQVTPELSPELSRRRIAIAGLT